MVFLNRFIFRQDMEVTMSEVWIRYKDYYILQLSNRSWGVSYGLDAAGYKLRVFDSLEKALRWIDGE